MFIPISSNDKNTFMHFTMSYLIINLSLTFKCRVRMHAMSYTAWNSVVGGESATSFLSRGQRLDAVREVRDATEGGVKGLRRTRGDVAHATCARQKKTLLKLYITWLIAVLF